MNEVNSYNLIDEQWLPVLLKGGSSRTVSLGEIFSNKEEIVDLSLNPYERVAIFRLLLCITQAAFGPERLKNTEAWESAKGNVGEVVTAYLRKWHGRFFLYGPKAFLQPDDLKPCGDGTPCSKLIFSLASGNNATLFDHDALQPNRLLPDAMLAIGLCVFQNFSAAGRSSICEWSQMQTQPSVKAAPCREKSMLFTLLCGETLLESIWMNLLTEDWVVQDLCATWGIPAWELEDLSRTSTVSLSKTLCGRLVPLSRAIKLTKGCPSFILGEAVQYPQFPDWREPMATVKKVGKENEETFTYVSVDPSRMPWRDLSSILTLNNQIRSATSSALALRHLKSLEEFKGFTLWTGGLQVSQAKELDAIEWKTSLTVEELEESFLQSYSKAIQYADEQNVRLRNAIKSYAKHINCGDANRFTSIATQYFWDILALPTHQLYLGSKEYDICDWKERLYQVAKEVYQTACPIGNARQVEAYAQGFGLIAERE